MSDSEGKAAISLRFPDPTQRAAIAAAAKAAGMSMQQYILSAAYDRATAVETAFLDAFDTAVTRTSEAFAAEASSTDPSPQQREAEQNARQALQAGQGHAA
jgi:uncharacterized protein (DUF1778 family)